MISERTKTELVRRFFSGTGSTYDSIVNLCTLGFDRLWKRKIVAKIPRESRRIMDQACGTGILTIRIAQRFPQGQIIGVDLTREYLEIAGEKVRSRGLNNITLIQGPAETVRPGQGFDCITSSYLAKYADLEVLIENLKFLLRDGGMVIMHDFTYPLNRIMAESWEFYFKLLQTLGSRRYPQWKAVFYDLPGFLKESRWSQELIDLLPRRGFKQVTCESLTFGTSAIITAIKS